MTELTPTERLQLALMLTLTSTTGINDAVDCMGLDKVFTATRQATPHQQPFATAVAELTLELAEVEPTLGFEPRTCCLRNSCSTTELCRREGEYTC